MPHIVGLALIVIVWASSPQQVYAYIPALHETIELSIPVEYNIPIKIALSVSILIVVLLNQFFRDYAKFVPTGWDFKVFFILEDLESVVNSFSPAEREKLRIPNNWHGYHYNYIDYMNGLLRQYKAPDFAKFGRNTLGIGTYKYRYRKAPGWQRYYLEHDSGYVRFEFYSEEETVSLVVEFVPKNQHTDIVEGSFRDVLHRFNTIVSPTFRQIVQLDHPFVRRSIMDLTCPTRISFFPRIDVSRTLYLVDIRTIPSEITDISENVSNYMVPICYAINRV